MLPVTDPPETCRARYLPCPRATAIRVLILLNLAAIPGCAERRGDYEGDVISAGSQDCAITAVPIATISGDHVGIGMVRLSDSHIYLENVNRVAVFDYDGEFLRWLGRRGNGPGEFLYIQDIVVLSGGRLAVFEAHPARLTVLDSMGKAVSTVPLPVATERGGVVMRDDGSFVIAGTPAARERFGAPIVHITGDGEVLQYIGEDETEQVGPIRGLVVPRLVTVHSKLGYLSIPRVRYDIEVWDPTTLTKQTIAPVAEWFTWPAPLPDPTNPHAVGAPENQFVALGVDENDHTWVVARVNGKDWEQGVQNGRVVDYEAWTDQRIEVWDVEQRKILCTGTFHPHIPDLGFAGLRQVASYDEDANGEPSITLWQLAVERRSLK